MNKDRIDKIGVAAAVSYFCRLGYFNPHIAFDDKIAVWDGNIEVHKTEDSQKAQDIDFLIDVQVKSSEVEDLDAIETITQRISVSDLNHYLNKGGTLLIKALVNKTTSKLYFAYLGKIQLNSLLEQCADTQGDKTIQLKEAPVSAHDLIPELRSIHLQGKHNLIKIDSLVNRSDYTLNTKIGPVPKETNPIIWLASHATDILVDLPEHEEPFYLSAGPSFILSETEVEQPVSINGMKLFDSFQIGTRRNGGYYRINDFLRFDHEIEGKNMSNYTIKPSAHKLGQYIRELKFVYLLNKHKCFSLGEIQIDASNFELDPNSKREIYRLLKFWTNVASIFVNMNWGEPKFDVQDLSEEDFAVLHEMIEYLVDNKPIPVSDIDDRIKVYSIGGLHYALGITENEGSYKYIDINYCQSICVNNETVGEQVYPIYAYLALNNIFPENLSYDRLIETYDKSKGAYELLDIANHNVLSYISHYDLTQNTLLLQKGLELSEWQIENASKNEIEIFTLNKFQIKKRLNIELSEEEVGYLLNLPSDNPQIAFAVNVILNDKVRAKKSWETLSEEEKSFITNLPIYVLFEKLTKNNG